jgi:hypothetical protein
MTIQVWVSGIRRVPDPTGMAGMSMGRGMSFYPWVGPIPNRTKVGTGVDIISHPRVTRRVP